MNAAPTPSLLRHAKGHNREYAEGIFWKGRQSRRLQWADPTELGGFGRANLAANDGIAGAIRGPLVDLPPEVRDAVIGDTSVQLKFV